MSEISASDVKKLREQTGAGFMDCKKALTETGGDLDKAADLLRKQGVKTAAKKAGRVTTQGWIGSYVHSNGKIGVLVEVLCETDFVAKNEVFQSFLKDLSMHIAAFNPQALDSDGLDPGVVNKERELFLESDEVQSEPENVRPKLVEDKMAEYYSEVCLLQQKWVKDNKRTVKDAFTDLVSSVGENMSISRFTRMEMGQGWGSSRSPIS